MVTLVINGNELTTSFYVPFKRLIVNAPLSYDELYPPEEIDHFLRIREPITYVQIYEYLNKTRKKDRAEGFEVIKAWSNTIEACDNQVR